VSPRQIRICTRLNRYFFTFLLQARREPQRGSLLFVHLLFHLDRLGLRPSGIVLLALDRLVGAYAHVIGLLRFQLPDHGLGRIGLCNRHSLLGSEALLQAVLQLIAGDVAALLPFDRDRALACGQGGQRHALRENPEGLINGARVFPLALEGDRRGADGLVVLVGDGVVLTFLQHSPAVLHFWCGCKSFSGVGLVLHGNLAIGNVDPAEFGDNLLCKQHFTAY